jgi:activator of HSP90 ATPase
MAKTIEQKVVFKNTTPKALYDLYMKADLHSLISGSPAKITEKEGAPFSAHGGYITGKNLHLIKDELIVQTWRGMDWDKKELDSVFMIKLEKKGKDTVLHAVHALVPDKSVAGVEKGWHGHYWKPWKQHLAGKKITRPKM